MTLTLPPRGRHHHAGRARGDARASEPVIHAAALGRRQARPGRSCRACARCSSASTPTHRRTSRNSSFAAKDATDLATFFKAQEGKTYGKVETKVLPNAKRVDVLDGLEWLEKGSEEGDVNLLFLAGHGITDEQQQFYYMAADSDPDRRASTGVSRDEILRTIRNRKGAMVVMLDACHSGDTAAGVQPEPRRHEPAGQRARRQVAGRVPLRLRARPPVLLRARRLAERRLHQGDAGGPDRAGPTATSSATSTPRSCRSTCAAG